MRRPRRILVYRCGALGDTIVALPAIHALRDAFPAAELALMTANEGDGVVWTDEVLRDFGWFAHVVTYRARELATVRGRGEILRRVRAFGPDLVVHLGSDRDSGLRLLRDRLFFALAGARRFVGGRASKATFFGRLRRERREYPYEVDRLLDVARRAGAAAGAPRFDLPLGTAHAERVAALLAARGIGQTRPLVAMCPGSKQGAKRWPVERWGELGARIVAHGADVAIVGGADEARVAATVARSWPAGRWTSLAGELSIMESAEALRRACLYVGNDTGAMHLAAAVATPCVAVFGARELARSWHPYGAAHVVLRHDAVPCANCYLAECTSEGLRCLTAITVDQVWTACRAKLPMRQAA
ncbi:MAG TPA: glycosyltransferase family 9 protein [Candidatus Eisenbacteria bacterium]|nr:glycosyltransferase family 9 protein [Candidatus Eisenbacteria bacterium]